MKFSPILYPFLLVAFILLIFYLFFFGDNGLLSYKTKILQLNELKAQNRVLYEQVKKLEHKIDSLLDNDKYQLEFEARKNGFKKKGDTILVIRNSAFLDSLAQEYESKYRKTDKTKTIDYIASYNKKVILGFILNVAIAFVLVLILPVGNNKS